MTLIQLFIKYLLRFWNNTGDAKKRYLQGSYGPVGKPRNHRVKKTKIEVCTEYKQSKT